MPLFWGGAIHARCKPHVTHRDVPTPLYTKCTQSQQGANTDLQLYNRASFILHMQALTQGHMNTAKPQSPRHPGGGP